MGNSNSNIQYLTDEQLRSYLYENYQGKRIIPSVGKFTIPVPGERRAYKQNPPGIWYVMDMNWDNRLNEAAEETMSLLSSDNIYMKKKGYLASIIKGELLEAYRLDYREKSIEINENHKEYLKYISQQWAKIFSNNFVCNTLEAKKWAINSKYNEKEMKDYMKCQISSYNKSG